MFIPSGVEWIELLNNNYDKKMFLFLNQDQSVFITNTTVVQIKSSPANYLMYSVSYTYYMGWKEEHW